MKTLNTPEYIFMVLLLICISITGCKQNETSMFDDHYLFIEYGLCNAAEPGELYVNLPYGGSFESKLEGFLFDEAKLALKVDTAFLNSVSELDFKLDVSDKFLFGGYYMMTPNTNKVGCLVAEKNFDFRDSLLSYARWYWQSSSQSLYYIKMADCSPQGEAKILFDNKEIFLKPNEVFSDTITFSHHSSDIECIKDIITIKNHGFIKKENVSYY